MKGQYRCALVRELPTTAVHFAAYHFCVDCTVSDLTDLNQCSRSCLPKAFKQLVFQTGLSSGSSLHKLVLIRFLFLHNSHQSESTSFVLVLRVALSNGDQVQPGFHPTSS